MLCSSNQTVMAVVAWQITIGKTLATAWLIGVAVILLRWIVRHACLVNFLNNNCDPITPDQIGNQLRPSIELPSNLRILMSDRIQGPFCWQLHQPTIVLPRFVLNEGGLTLRHVLLHELEHLRTNHPVQLFLQRCCASVLWFHPAVWWAGRRAELAREYLCDEVATRDDCGVASYLQTLIKIAERGVGSSACSLAFGNRPSAIVQRKNRLVRLAETKLPYSGKRQRFALITLMLVAVLAHQVWLPVNALASSRSHWTPWPTWSASVLHDFGISVRDFERFDERCELHELLEADH
jgi:beta-lactamase regulating signal transducer with metallopeptidase domain